MAQVLTFPKSLPVHARVSQEPLVPTPLLGMLLFLFTELMFFAGLISAFLVLKDRSILWPPLDQPRLPIAVTLFNTGILLSSAWTLSRALGQWKRSDFQSGKFWLRITLLLGILFLGIQGLEWARLISYGLLKLVWRNLLSFSGGSWSPCSRGSPRPGGRMSESKAYASSPFLEFHTHCPLLVFRGRPLAHSVWAGLLLSRIAAKAEL